MIVVRVELWSARTGTKTELARMEICNDATGENGGAGRLRNYVARTLRGRTAAALARRQVQRQGAVKQWPSEAVHIWNLVAAALSAMGYGGPDSKTLRDVEVSQMPPLPGSLVSIKTRREVEAEHGYRRGPDGELVPIGEDAP